MRVRLSLSVHCCYFMCLSRSSCADDALSAFMSGSLFVCLPLYLFGWCPFVDVSTRTTDSVLVRIVLMCSCLCLRVFASACASIFLSLLPFVVVYMGLHLLCRVTWLRVISGQNGNH